MKHDINDFPGEPEHRRLLIIEREEITNVLPERQRPGLQRLARQISDLVGEIREDIELRFGRDLPKKIEQLLIIKEQAQSLARIESDKYLQGKRIRQRYRDAIATIGIKNFLLFLDLHLEEFEEDLAQQEEEAAREQALDELLNPKEPPPPPQDDPNQLHMF